MSGQRAGTPNLPFERQVEWVGAVAALGGILGYIAWAFCDLLFPDLELNAGVWTRHGIGLLGAAALSWLVSGTL